MELIIGCIILALFSAFLLYFCKNVTFIVKIEYPEVHYDELKDIYDEKGDSTIDENQITFDDILKEINDLMLDKEESDG